MTDSSLVLTAMGMVNALGNDNETVWRNLLAGWQGGLVLSEAYIPGKTVRVGAVQYDPHQIIWPKNWHPYRCRNNELLFLAFQQIEKALANCLQRYGAERVGIVLGSSTSGVGATEEAFDHYSTTGQWPESFYYLQHELGGPSEFLGKLTGARGPCYTISTACSSSGKVFASGRALIRGGWCDAVIVGGADALCRLTVNGFTALETLSGQPANPFSQNREGFNIGEAATLFILEKGNVGVQLKGVGESSDAFHMSAPLPDGSGAIQAMRAALEDAAVTSERVAYINLHGTGTILNDQMEARAVHSMLGSSWVSSTKGMTGHTLGAAGAMEAGFCWLALNNRVEGRTFLPPHVWDGVGSNDIPSLRWVEKGFYLSSGEPMAFLSNSFGFGGSNCSVILGRAG